MHPWDAFLTIDPGEPVEARIPVDQRAPVGPAPANFAQRTSNPLRPSRLTDMIGQDRLKRFLSRIIGAAVDRQETLDHMLLVGASGLGKSTVAHVVANELSVDVYQVEAPVSQDTLLELRLVMDDGDVLFIDEVHQQAVGDRRGRSSNTQPEVLFGVMEDRTIVSGVGVLPYPEITVIAATTDEGALPDAFVNRFPLRPYLEPYTEDELAHIAALNAGIFHLGIEPAAARLFAQASRGVPRQINNYTRNAASLTTTVIDVALATEVLHDFNRVTDDGLTIDMQKTLTFLFTRAMRTHKASGDITYQASLSTIATAIGKSRDSKAVTLRVEPYLIERGFLQVGHGGRLLTPAGIKRAKELLKP